MPRVTQRVLWWGLSIAVVGAFVVVGVSWAAGGVLVAPANFKVVPPTTELPIESLRLESESGSRLATWYIPATNSKATVILLHPIRGSRLWMLERAKLFWHAGFTVVAIDLQAHGESPGKSITIGFLEKHDVRAAVAFARLRDPDNKIAVNGVSLGGAAALLGSPLGVDAMILESVYATIEQAIDNRLRSRIGPLSPVVSPLLTMQLQPRLGISCSDLHPIDGMAKVSCPVLVMTGNCDRHTRLSETKQLYDAAMGEKELVIFEGATHEDLQQFDPALYATATLDFLRRYLTLADSRLRLHSDRTTHVPAFPE